MNRWTVRQHKTNMSPPARAAGDKVSYYTIWLMFHRIKGVNSKYGNHHVFMLYISRENMAERLNRHGNTQALPKLADTWHKEACWLVNSGILLMTSQAELFLEHNPARRTAGIPYRFQQHCRWIWCNIRRDGSLEGQIYNEQCGHQSVSSGHAAILLYLANNWPSSARSEALTDLGQEGMPSLWVPVCTHCLLAFHIDISIISCLLKAKCI